MKGNPIKREIIINCESLETRVAVLENGRLEEFMIEQPQEERLVGSIYKGRIQNLEDGLQAAFVDIGMSKNAFLHYWDMIPEDAARLAAEEEGSYRGSMPRTKRFSPQEIAKKFPVGSEIVVQVTKGPISTKGPRVTASLSIPGRYLVMLPGSNLRGVSRKIEDSKERSRLKQILDRLPGPQGVGLIVRTAGEGARGVSFARDMRSLLQIWDQLQSGIRDHRAPVCLYQEPDVIERVVRDWVTEDVDRIVLDSQERWEQVKNLASQISRRVKSRIQLYDGHSPMFEHFNIERQIEDAFQRKVQLKSGGYIIIDETEALISIDVNTGRHKGGTTQEDVILQVNLEAVEEVARQLRLRNVGGIVVLDLIDMKQKKNRNAVYKALRQILTRDKARTNVLPISPLGLLEMTRQRVEEGILSSRYMDCPYCRGRGSVKSPLTMSIEIQRRATAIWNSHRKSDPGLQLQITVHPTILERLRKEDEQILVDLQSRFEGQLGFRSDPTRHIEDFVIRNGVSGEVYYSSTPLSAAEAAAVPPRTQEDKAKA
ncbi:MAG: Rne/Rng family ribonuclease [Kiritimatiellia bacterium]